MKRIFFIVTGMNPKAGGLTRSLYERASFLSEYYDVNIITLNYQKNMHSIIDYLNNTNRLGKNVKIINFYIDLHSKNNLQPKVHSDNNYLDVLNNSDNYYVDRKDLFCRYFTNMGYYAYLSYKDKSQKEIDFIDFMNSNDPLVLDKRYEFLNNNVLFLNHYNNSKKTNTIMFNRLGRPILNLWMSTEGKVNRVFDLQEADKIKSQTFDMVLVNWLENLINKEDIIFFDSNFSYTMSLTKSIKARKIVFIHSHQDYCNDTKFFKNLDDSQSIDKYVFLTTLQKEDFKKINSYIYDNSCVIPHPSSVHLLNDSHHKRKNIVVTISRLVSNKLINLSIKAFANIANQFPDYIYEIYGNGSEKENLQKLIIDLNMKDRIFVKEYTTTPLNVFARAACSISLTKFEGFGLSILESLSAGCPVISSDVKYGPKELIKEGINGELTDNSIESIQKAIIKILSNLQQYQGNCKDSISNYSIDLWKNRLLGLLA